MTQILRNCDPPLFRLAPGNRLVFIRMAAPAGWLRSPSRCPGDVLRFPAGRPGLVLLTNARGYRTESGLFVTRCEGNTPSWRDAGRNRSAGFLECFGTRQKHASRSGLPRSWPGHMNRKRVRSLWSEEPIRTTQFRSGEPLINSGRSSLLAKRAGFITPIAVSSGATVQTGNTEAG